MSSFASIQPASDISLPPLTDSHTADFYARSLLFTQKITDLETTMHTPHPPGARLQRNALGLPQIVASTLGKVCTTSAETRVDARLFTS
jgi:hypothetical protein